MKKKLIAISIITVLFTLFAQAQHRVAVLPLTYIGEGSDARLDEMPYQLQDIVASYMSRNSFELKVIEVTELNAILYKKGIDMDNLRQYSPKELAKLLHVDYVIMGSVIQDPGNVVTVENSYNRYREAEYRRRYYDRGRVSGRSHHTGTSVTRQNIQTQVTLSIYNEEGSRIYTKSRESILTDADAYKYALHYLLKRTPLYNR